jgi:ABC-type polysaccharide/polyol phosphate export permease
MILIIDDIKKNLHTIRIQFFVTIKTTVASTRLGAIWWILDPLILMLLYTFVVKIVFARGGEDYHLFALCGIVTWQSFSRSINLSSNALGRNIQLIKQTSFPMHLYVLLPPLVQSFFYFIGLAIVAIWNFKEIGIHTISIIAVLIPMILIPYTIGLFLSIYTVKLPDIGKVVPYLLRFGFYISPVLYPPDRIYELKKIPDFIKSIYSLNPVVHLITFVRNVLLYGETTSLFSILILVIVTLAFLQIGIINFRVQCRDIVKEI